MPMDIPKHIDPKDIEGKWYERWKKDKVFHAEVDWSKKPFSMVIPPPNVTGSLHMGHALNVTLHDIVWRFKHMQGYNTVWVPGTDHAGIATQTVVERKLLAEEGKTRWELGKEEFIKRVWQWKEESGGRILSQMERMGISVDWDRLRFTMDEVCSRAVRRAFKTLYDKGLIYRGDYIINWCPHDMTALSDLEVEHEEIDGFLVYSKYPFTDGTGYMVVATTRPETIPADVAIAVNPKAEYVLVEKDGKKYLFGKVVVDNDSLGWGEYNVVETYKGKDLVGKFEMKLPIGPEDRVIGIITDEEIDPDFGTAALKVTPAHDAVDFEIGKKYNLPIISVINLDGTMNEQAGPELAGLDRFEARDKAIEIMEQKGLVALKQPYKIPVGKCYRCGTIIEPMVSKQWFVKLTAMVDEAKKTVEEGRTRIIPDRWTKVYFDWMNNIKDWCISRQIWWGHRIPAWYCKDCGHITVAEETPEKCEKCGSTNIEQDPDVLDTWFSSALWPFEVFGWPEETEDLKYFFPTSLLITGWDILFFWVSKMIFMSVHLTGKEPFKDVYLHGLVRDEKGQKMSKTKGNVVDPLELVDKYGADGLRFGLAHLVSKGQDIKLSEEKIEHGRNFMTKIWNASRYILMRLDGETPARPENMESELTLPSKWILSRLTQVKKQMTELLEDYEFGAAARLIEDFFWKEFCDWYLELSKFEDTEATRWTLLTVLKDSLKMIHPFMPFVTEEIWSLLPDYDGTYIVESGWVSPDEYMWEDILEEADKFMEVVRGIRALKADIGLGMKKVPMVYVKGEGIDEFIQRWGKYIEGLARLESLEGVDTKPHGAYSVVARDIVLYLPLEGLLDIEAEKKRLQKKLAQLEKEISRRAKKLANENFVKKAPAEVVEKVKAELEDLSSQKERVLEHLKDLEA
ncbi:valine--tRNA ligase [bacterium 3DAC]|nr:valine--tRNA ligase [bacterium 3DAC]